MAKTLSVIVIITFAIIIGMSAALLLLGDDSEFVQKLKGFCFGYCPNPSGLICIGYSPREEPEDGLPLQNNL